MGEKRTNVGDPRSPPFPSIGKALMRCVNGDVALTQAPLVARVAVELARLRG